MNIKFFLKDESVSYYVIDKFFKPGEDWTFDVKYTYYYFYGFIKVEPLITKSDKYRYVHFGKSGMMVEDEGLPLCWIIFR